MWGEMGKEFRKVGINLFDMILLFQNLVDLYYVKTSKKQVCYEMLMQVIQL